jgi:hypothetical protein
VVASCYGNGSPEAATFSAQTAQYVQVVLTTPDPSSWWSISQFLVFAPAGTTNPPVGNCSGSTSGESPLAESGFTATSPVPASSAGAQNPITNAVNGNTNAGRFTTQAAQAAGDEYIVNMGSAKTFDEIQLAAPDSPTDYASSLRLSSVNGVTDGLHIASSSGINLSGNINVPATGGWQTWATVTASVTLPAGQQTLTVAQDNGGWNIHSIASTASAASANCSASLTGTELARTGWAASTNTSGDPAASAIDGDLTTRFSTGAAQAPGQELVINMGSAQTFSELDMEVPDSAGDYARGFQVEVSADGTDWTSVATCTGAGSSEVVSFPAQAYQYAKVTLTQSVSPNWWSVDELYLRN